MTFYVYIVECRDGSLYTGYTKNIRARIDQHNGLGFVPGAKYTRSRRPVLLQYLEKYVSKSEAMQREHAIKQLPKEEKLALLKTQTKSALLAAI